MSLKKIVIGVVLIFIGLPLLSALTFAAWASLHNKTNGRLVSSGQEREYLLHVPPKYDRATPAALVISMHGAALWPASQMKMSRWNEVADESGFIVVYPSGTGFPRIFPMEGAALAADVKFISDLIDGLEAPTPSIRSGSSWTGFPTAAAWPSRFPARCRIGSRRSGWSRARNCCPGAGARTRGRCR